MVKDDPFLDALEPESEPSDPFEAILEPIESEDAFLSILEPIEQPKNQYDYLKLLGQEEKAIGSYLNDLDTIRTQMAELDESIATIDSFEEQQALQQQRNQLRARSVGIEVGVAAQMERAEKVRNELIDYYEKLSRTEPKPREATPARASFVDSAYAPDIDVTQQSVEIAEEPMRLNEKGQLVQPITGKTTDVTGREAREFGTIYGEKAGSAIIANPSDDGGFIVENPRNAEAVISMAGDKPVYIRRDDELSALEQRLSILRETDPNGAEAQETRRAIRERIANPPALQKEENQSLSRIEEIQSKLQESNQRVMDAIRGGFIQPSDAEAFLSTGENKELMQEMVDTAIKLRNDFFEGSTGLSNNDVIITAKAAGLDVSPVPSFDEFYQPEEARDTLKGQNDALLARIEAMNDYVERYYGNANFNPVEFRDRLIKESTQGIIYNQLREELAKSAAFRQKRNTYKEMEGMSESEALDYYLDNPDKGVAALYSKLNNITASVFNSIPQGVGSVMQGFGTIQSAFQGKDATDTLLYQLGEKIAEESRQFLLDPTITGEAEELAGAIGTVGQYLLAGGIIRGIVGAAASGVVRAIPSAATATARVAPVVSFSTLAGTTAVPQSIADIYAQGKSLGLSDEDAKLTALVVGPFSGSIQLMNVTRLLGKIERGVAPGVKRALATALESAVNEGLVEATGQWMNEESVKYIYTKFWENIPDEERGNYMKPSEIDSNALKAGQVGGAVGLLFGFMAYGLGAKGVRQNRDRLAVQNQRLSQEVESLSNSLDSMKSVLTTPTEGGRGAVLVGSGNSEKATAPSQDVIEVGGVAVDPAKVSEAEAKVKKAENELAEIPENDALLQGEKLQELAQARYELAQLYRQGINNLALDAIVQESQSQSKENRDKIMSAIKVANGVELSLWDYQVLGIAEDGSVTSQSLVSINPDGTYRLQQSFLNEVTGLVPSIAGIVGQSEIVNRVKRSMEMASNQGEIAQELEDKADDIEAQSPETAKALREQAKTHKEYRDRIIAETNEYLQTVPEAFFEQTQEAVIRSAYMLNQRAQATQYQVVREVEEALSEEAELAEDGETTDQQRTTAEVSDDKAEPVLSEEGIKKQTTEFLQGKLSEYQRILRENVTREDPASQILAEKAQEGLNRIREELARRSNDPNFVEPTTQPPQKATTEAPPLNLPSPEGLKGDAFTKQVSENRAAAEKYVDNLPEGKHDLFDSGSGEYVGTIVVKSSVRGRRIVEFYSDKAETNYIGSSKEASMALMWNSQTTAEGKRVWVGVDVVTQPQSPAEQSAAVIEQSLRDFDNLRQSPQGLSALNRLLQGEEMAGEVRAAIAEALGTPVESAEGDVFEGVEGRRSTSQVSAEVIQDRINLLDRLATSPQGREALNAMLRGEEFAGDLRRAVEEEIAAGQAPSEGDVISDFGVEQSAQPEVKQGPVERDPSKPEQMTPEEWLVLDAEMTRITEMSDSGSGMTAQEEGFLNANYDTWTGMIKTPAQVIMDTDWSGATRRASRIIDPTYEYTGDTGGARNIGNYILAIAGATSDRNPVSSAAVDTYGINLPEGYVKQGDLYVYQPSQQQLTPAKPPVRSKKSDTLEQVADKMWESGMSATLPDAVAIEINDAARNLSKTITTPWDDAATRYVEGHLRRDAADWLIAGNSFDGFAMHGVGVKALRDFIRRAKVRGMDIQAMSLDATIGDGDTTIGDIVDATDSAVSAPSLEQMDSVIAEEAAARDLKNFAKAIEKDFVSELTQAGRLAHEYNKVRFDRAKTEEASRLLTQLEEALDNERIDQSANDYAQSIAQDFAEAAERQRQSVAGDVPVSPVRARRTIESKAAGLAGSPPSGKLTRELAKLRKLKGKQAGSTVLFTDIPAEMVEYGRAIYRRGRSFTDWAGQMLSRFGESVRSFLATLWDNLNGGYLLPHARERGAVGTGIVTAKQDADYLAAVERGDMETAQRMVDDAATTAGYQTVLHHGTPRGITGAMDRKAGNNLWDDFESWGIWTTQQKSTASRYGEPKTFYADPGESLIYRGKDAWAEWAKDFAEIAYPGARISEGADSRAIRKSVSDFLDLKVAIYNKNKAAKNQIPSHGFSKKGREWVAANFPGADGYNQYLKANGYGSVQMRNARVDGQEQNITVVLESNQLKLADPVTRDDQGNVIPLSQRFNPDSADIRYSLTQERAFYSQLQNVLERKMPNAASPQQVRGIVDPGKGSGVKGEELKWSGFEQAVDRIASENGSKVPKAALLEYLRDEGAVRFEEVTLAERRKPTQAEEDRYAMLSNFPEDALDQGQREELARLEELVMQKHWETPNEAPTKYAQYQLPGGENYREVVLAMPETETKEQWSIAEIGGPLMGSPFESKERAQKELDELGWDKSKYEIRWDDRFPAPKKSDYTSSHFPDTPNYVAHMRLNERTDADGKPGLFIEEIQSDRHQAGRERGYATQVLTADDARGLGYSVYQAKSNLGTTAFFVDGPENFKDITSAGFRTEKEGWDWAINHAKKNSTAIPDAPFRKDWPVQMFKRALRDAVESGKEWIGWTTGETQVERYDLSKQVEFINVEHVQEAEGVFFVDIATKGDRGRNDVINLEVENGVVREGEFSGKPLSDVIGKDMAEKIVSVPKGESKVLKGDALKVGGEGMKGFYDTILPKEIAKYVKQWGAKVEKFTLPTPDSKGNFVGEVRGQPVSVYGTLQEANAELEAGEIDSIKGTPIWRVTITPEMRKSIQTIGQPLFSRQSQAQGIGMEATQAKLTELGYAADGMVVAVDEPGAGWDGRTILRDGKVIRIEINAATVTDVEAVVAHELAEAANADGVLDNLISNLSQTERDAIQSDITRLGYAESVRSREAAARGVEQLVKTWRGRNWFQRAVGQVLAWANKAGLPMTRLVAEAIAARAVAEVDANVRKWTIADALGKLPGARRVVMDGMEAVLIPPSQMAEAQSIAAYHGTPHKIDPEEGFRLDRIGTGEGAQAYGWGLYFAEVRDVGEGYKTALSGGAKLMMDGKPSLPSDATSKIKDMLAQGELTQQEARQFELIISGYIPNGNTVRQAVENYRNSVREDWKEVRSRIADKFLEVFPPVDSGNIYTVELDVEPDQLLDWDKPLSEQSEKVREAVVPIIKKLSKSFPEVARSDINGSGIYNSYAQHRGGNTQAVSEDLLVAGIPGIRYLDGQSRGEGQGSYNYVIFDDSLIKIAAENDIEVRESRIEPEASPVKQKLTLPEPGTFERKVYNTLKPAAMVVQKLSNKRRGENPKVSLQQLTSDFITGNLSAKELEIALVNDAYLTERQAEKVAAAFAGARSNMQEIFNVKAEIRSNNSRGLTNLTPAERKERTLDSKLEEVAATMERVVETINLLALKEYQKDRSGIFKARLLEAKKAVRLIPRALQGNLIPKMVQSASSEKQLLELAGEVMRVVEANRTRRALDRAKKKIAKAKLAYPKLSTENRELINQWLDNYMPSKFTPKTEERLRSVIDKLKEGVGEFWAEEAEARAARIAEGLTPDSKTASDLRRAEDLDKVPLSELAKQENGKALLIQIAEGIELVLAKDRQEKGIRLVEGYENSAQLSQAIVSTLSEIPGLTRRDKKGNLELPTVWFGLFDTITPEAMMNLTGSKELVELIYNRMMRDGQRDQLNTMQGWKQELVEAVKEKTGMDLTSKDFRSWSDETVEVDGYTEDGEKGRMTITRRELWELYASLLDPRNLKEAARRPFLIQSKERQDYNEWRLTGDSLAELNRLINEGATDLDPSPDLQMAEYIHGFYQKMRTKLFPVLEQVYGYTPVPRDGYYPTTADKATVKGKAKTNPLTEMKNLIEDTVDGVGFLKEVTEGATSRMVIKDSLERLVYHMDNTSRIAAYLPIVTDAKNVLERRSVVRAIESKFGKKGYDVIYNGMMRQAIPTRRDTNDAEGFEAVMEFIIRGSAPALLGLKLGAMSMNPTGIPIGLAFLGEKAYEYMLKADYSDPKKLDQLLFENSPYYRERYGSGGFTQEYTQGVVRKSGNVLFREGGTEIPMLPIEWTDRGGGLIRAAILRQYLRDTRKDLVEGTDEFNLELAWQWEKMMYRSENTSHGLGRTALLQGAAQNRYMAVLLAFTSSVSKIWSAQIEAVASAQMAAQMEDGPRKKALTDFSYIMGVSVVMSAVYGSAVREFLSWLMGFNDDEEEWEDVMKRFGARMAGGQILGSAPIVGNFLSSFTNAIVTGEPSSPYSMSTIQSLADATNRTFNNLVAASRSLIDGTVTGDGRQKWVDDLAKAGWSSLDPLGVVTRLPLPAVRQYYRIAENLIESSNGKHRKEMGYLTNEEANENARKLSREKTGEISDEFNRIRRGLMNEDYRAFKDGVNRLKEVRPNAGHKEIAGAINRQFSALSAIESGRTTPSEIGLNESSLMDIRQQRRILMDQLNVFWRRYAEEKKNQ